jgi:hypothetical protein
MIDPAHPMALRSRSLITPVATVMVLACTIAFGCAAPADSGPTGASNDDVIDVPLTAVERQTIGSTWIYAHAAWAETMHGAATGEVFDMSRSYAMYWHWFDQITNGTAMTIATGGNWQTANAIAKKYGVIRETSFLGAGTDAEPIAKQTAALAAIDVSLASGALSTPAARHDRTIVRSELDRVWALGTDVRSALDHAFGADVARSFSSL